MEKVSSHLKEKLKDPYFKELYELEQQKLEIANVLIKHRIKYKLTQRKLAEKIGVTQQYISKIENGEFSNIKTLEIMFLLLGFKIRLNVKPLPRRIFKKISPSARAKLRKELVAA